MKYATAILIFFLASSCHRAKTLTYENGLENCNQILKERQKSSQNELLFEPPDCLIGAQIPEFEATTIDGAKINRASLMGKVTILNFWFTTCAPCVAEIPGLNAIANKFGTEKVNYIAIGRDRAQDVKDFLAETPWKFEQIADGNAIIMDVFKIRWGYPTTFLLNKNAEIILAFSGGKSDSTAVAEVQNKLVPAIEKELK